MSLRVNTPPWRKSRFDALRDPTMQTMHPTLLVGPADWNPTKMPREEFDSRLAMLWQNFPGAAGAVVYGNSSHHTALAYLTHFTPKLEAALALIPRGGEAQLLIGGGVNMVPAARPLTFVEKLTPLREAAKTAAAWARALPGGDILLIGGDAMPFGMRRAFDQSLSADRHVEPADAVLRARMRLKHPPERDAMRAACATLNAAVTALRDASSNGDTVTDCILRAEHVALQYRAQDVRSLFSHDGGRTLRPFDIPIARRCDPLQVYLAVRHDGYWADGFVRLATGRDALQEGVDGILNAMIAAAKPGLSCRDLSSLVDAGRGRFRLHPLADGAFGNCIGLSLDEPPMLTRDGDARLDPGAIYSLRAGLVDETGGGAISSAIVAVSASGADILWRDGTRS
jgi:Xaa-Pro aminopeptidase